MKGKTLVRIGAALTALSMLGTVSAFAAPTFDVKYNETSNQLELTNIQGASEGDSTFLVYDLSAAARALSDETAPPYTDQEIYYVDQVKLSGTTANLKLAVGAAASDKYKVVLGMGGAGITTPALEVVELRQKPITIQSYVPFEWEQADTTKFLLGTTGTAIITELTKEDAANKLPTEIVANTDAETDAAKRLTITGWAASEAVGNVITLTPQFSATGLTVPTDVAVPTVSVNLTNKITITDWVIGTEEDPKFATYTVSASDAKNVETVVNELAAARRARTEANADFQAGRNRAISFTWALKDSTQEEAFNAHTPGNYVFVGSNPAVVPDENVTLPEGVELVISESLTDAAKVTPEVTVNISEKTKVKITAVQMRDSNGNPITVTDNVYTVAEPVSNGTALATVKAALPTQLKVTGVEDASITIPDSLVFTIVDWDVYDANGDAVSYNPSPDNTTVYTLKPKTRRTNVAGVEGGEDYNYIFSLENADANLFPSAKVTVEGKVEITELTAPAATLDAGTAGVDALADAEAVMTAIGRTVAVRTPANTGLQLPIAWTAPEGGYKADVAGDYIFKGVVDTSEAPEGYKFAANLVTEFEVKVTVKSAAPAFMRGDANGDGKINGQDLGPIQVYIKSRGSRVPNSLEGADANGDGKVNGQDLGPIQVYIKSRGTKGILADK